MKFLAKKLDGYVHDEKKNDDHDDKDDDDEQKKSEKKPVRAWKQMNLVQTMKPDKNKNPDIYLKGEYIPIQEMNPYDIAPKQLKKSEIGRVFVNVRNSLIAAKTPGGKKSKHSEAFVLAHFNQYIQKNDDGDRILVVISTYSPCAFCIQDKQIEKLCNGYDPAMNNLANHILKYLVMKIGS